MIEGPWKVTFPAGLGAPESITMEKLSDWTQHPDPGVRYFSGGATYLHDITVDASSAAIGGPLFLDLGTVKEVAVVRVHGKQAGILWKAPYRIDLTPFLKPGANPIEITVVNTWNNRIVGDLQGNPGEKITRTNISGKFNPKSPLLPSGLLGPVTLHAPVFATCDVK
jgi:hypothetical protein